MTNNLFDRARSTNDLLETVEKLTKQKGRGGNTKAFFCPRHSERTPSLMVNVATGTWHCFGGCACGGDVVDFVEFFEFGTVTKGRMERETNGSLSHTSNRYQALAILVGDMDSRYEPVKNKDVEYSVERKIVEQDTVLLMHSNRKPTLDYFVGKRKLEEPTVDARMLGTALAYPHWYKWHDTNKPDNKYECVRYSIPWMRSNKPYMVNYRRDDVDCLRRLRLMDDEFLYDVRRDISTGTDYSPGDVTDDQLVRHLFGDKYLRNKGSSGFTIFNLDRLLGDGWLPYCTINEAEISCISCEESQLYSVSTSFKGVVDFAGAFKRVHQPIIFADNDGGTGLEKASKLAEAIKNPRTLIKLVPAPFKDMNELIAYDKIHGGNTLYNLKREIGIA